MAMAHNDHLQYDGDEEADASEGSAPAAAAAVAW